MRKLCIICLAFVAVLASCSRQKAEYPVLRLDCLMAEVPHTGVGALDSVTPVVDAMFAVLGRGRPTPEVIEAWSRSAAVEVFQPAVDSVFGTGSEELSRQIGHIMEQARRDSLGLPPMRFATVVWADMRRMVRIDSIMLIALNHYLGAEYPGYRGFNAYITRDKRPQMLPYDLAAALAATQYPMEHTSGATLLSWMLYEGALVEARMRLVPEADLADALGYTREQLRLLQSREKEIWQEMAARRLIYDTDPMTIDRYISPAPSTPLLSGQTPGRVGRFIGYRIVKAYLKSHPGTSLPQLLSPAFYASAATLVDSGY